MTDLVKKTKKKRWENGEIGIKKKQKTNKHEQQKGNAIMMHII